MKKNLIFICLLLIASAAMGQRVKSSPFKSLPKHEYTWSVIKNDSGYYSLAPSTGKITAWRFTGPIAGFMYPQNQVVTGIGFGYQSLKYVDATQKYYTNFSISGVLYAGGNTAPHSLNDVMSVGISAGFLNQLLMIGPAYNLPISNSKGTFGVVVNFSVPLN